ncbi:hypothetical protein ABZS95_36965 [Streptomyces sp. NPDC005479]|uniref:hypothetical protein n=1 Tax=Streptomyces sp. NPDC005479 TaxID=3154879 RepID=UPI0033BBF9F7
MKVSVIDLKQNLLHRIGAVGIALAAAGTLAMAGAPTASANGWVDTQETLGTTALVEDNADCLDHSGQCYGVLAHWDVELQKGTFYAYYSNMSCVGGGQVLQVDLGYRPSASRIIFQHDFSSKTLTPGWIESYEDNPCYNAQ